MHVPQQKIVTVFRKIDNLKKEALENKKTAEIERQKAIDSKNAADLEKQKAIDSKNTADLERQKAIDSKNTADLERQKAENLTLIAIASEQLEKDPTISIGLPKLTWKMSPTNPPRLFSTKDSI
jgi:hypothetical protein